MKSVFFPVLAAFLASIQTGECQGTTENFQSVFVGRCWDYDITRYKDVLPRVEAGCNELWRNFSRAFTYKSPCDVSQSDYQSFLDSAKQDLPTNKLLFWSGTLELAHKLNENGDRYITLEDTLVGYLVNSLTWCGQESSPGINYTRCPTWQDCPTEASESFWSGASTYFALQAKGEIQVLLYGSDLDRPAYRRSSFFAKYELPNLDVNKVSTVNVIVAHALDKPKIESCGTGSLVLLEEDVTARGFTYSCIDDPDAVMHLLCAEDPENPECKLA